MEKHPLQRKSELRPYKRLQKSSILQKRLSKKIKKMKKISSEEATKNYYLKKLEICKNLEKYLNRFDEKMSINEENIIYLMKKLDDGDLKENEHNLSEQQQVRFKDFFLSLMKKEVSVDFEGSEDDSLEECWGNKKVRGSRNFDI